MATTNAAMKPSPVAHPSSRQLINAFELTFPTRTPWRVSLYSAEPTEDAEPSHEERGTLKNAVWEFRKANRSACTGRQYFVLDIDPATVAVPTGWQIPANTEVGGFRFSPIQDVDVCLDDPEHAPIVSALLREAFKRAMKDHDGSALGRLWQHFNEFCQVPDLTDEDGILFCRKFGVEAVPLRGRRWCVQIRNSTQSVDPRSFSDYFQANETAKLAEWIGLKRKHRMNRRNRPTGVAVLRMQSVLGGKGWTAERLELDDADAVLATLHAAKSSRMAAKPQAIACQIFGKGRVDVPLEQLRLVLDTQITGEDHRETIIEPGDRTRLWHAVRDVLDQCDVFGVTVGVAGRPVDLTQLPGGIIGPPAIRIRGTRGEDVLLPPDVINEDSLRKRGRDRMSQLKRFGLLQHRPLNPVLACPRSKFSDARAERLRFDFNALLEDQHLPFRFSRFELYTDAQGLHRMILDQGHDSALVVLPEDRSDGNPRNSMHEQVKRTLTVPSQCIQYRNTLFDRKGEYRLPTRNDRDAIPLSQKLRGQYVNCIWGLAVKNHYVPFSPAEAFHYGVHIGIDVGGRDNNKAMLCIGYGYESPRDRLVFLAEEIPVDGAKAEPIPVEALESALRSALTRIAAELKTAGRTFELTRVLFLRDGPMLGDGDRWNERDALRPLLEYATKQGWIHGEPLWTIAEISKSAQGWRPVCDNGRIGNPLVGRWVAPFDDVNRVILSTTGAPYLTQGTASPILIQMSDFAGRLRREAVLRDIVWEADMCFTKPDMGMKLPWVLYVANEGALQAAQSYEITGVPV